MAKILAIKISATGVNITNKNADLFAETVGLFLEAVDDRFVIL